MSRYVLGGGMSGLAAGIASDFPVLEAADGPGGICSSYYLEPGGRTRNAERGAGCYRFEIGGGHWIFGADLATLNWPRTWGGEWPGDAPMRTYERVSAVLLPSLGITVPYPLQHHLHALGPDVASCALAEMTRPSVSSQAPRTLSSWLEQRFGGTLCELFYAPFHRLYTAGLARSIAPQDDYKSPLDLNRVAAGARMPAPSDGSGYNARFRYPVEGLGALARTLASRCDVHYGQRIVGVDPARRELTFVNGSSRRYERLISTLPLHKMMEMTGLGRDLTPDPHTSVLVLNIGATRRAQCPDVHWLYVPESTSGFHRVGFYSNVDASFLPEAGAAAPDRVALYVERAFPSSVRPTAVEIAAYTQDVIRELRAWQFIGEVEVCDPTWIDVAYTWSWPDSTWAATAIERLARHEIYQVGRYGRWHFQGIAESVVEGLAAGRHLRAA